MTLQQRLKELARTARLTAYSPGYTKMKEERPDISQALASIKKDILSKLPTERSLPKGDLTTAGLQVKFTAQGYNQALKDVCERLERYIGSTE